MENKSKVLKGKDIAQKMQLDMNVDLQKLRELNVTPMLKVVVIGNDPASESYVKMVQRRADKDGVEAEILAFDKDITEDKLCEVIKSLNEDSNVNGILIQMPLPKHIDKDKIVEIIDPQKDVDGFHLINSGKLYMGKDALYPCTAYGIVHMLEYSGIKIEGKNVVVIGRSLVVGRPVALLLLQRNATVTICHSKTVDLPNITKQADILIAAAGKKHMVKSDMVKKGAVVIDVGIHAIEGGITGDVDFDDVINVASMITPVPGGVGTTTLATLSWNTIKAALSQCK